ncbi:MAG: redoxin family protein [bacterium]|nr:redoxin family protein [bacterium]
MVASSAQKSQTEKFTAQEVGETDYLHHHRAQLFKDGFSFSGNERDKLWFNRGDGTFCDVSDLSGSDSPNDGRAVLATDFDDDGDVDLFVHELQRERHALYRNDLNQRYGGFLKLRLKATKSQWEAIGATVVVHTPAGPVAQVTSRGAGFSSCQAPELVFGLADAEDAKVEVHWPSGASETFGPLARGGRFLLEEASGEAQPIAGKPRRLPDPLPKGLRLGIGEKVPPFLAFDAGSEARRVDLAELSGGKPVYLNFWAKYCGPCVQELPYLEQLDEAGEVRVVAVCMDAPNDLELAAEVFRGRGADFPNYYLGAEASDTVQGVALQTIVDLERLPIPTTLVLDGEGKIVQIVRGPVEKALQKDGE